LKGFEEHANMQSESMRQLTSTAERKLVELKLALDKKIIESNDYYSHLQQALTQIQILRQENTALKDYIQKLTQLHQGQNANAQPSQSNAFMGNMTNPAQQPQQTQSNAHPAPTQSSQPTPEPQPTAPVPEPAQAQAAVQTPAPQPPPAHPPLTPQAPTSFGSPMTVPSTPAFMADNTPAPTPSGAPTPAWMPGGPTQASPPPRPQPPPKPAGPKPAESSAGASLSGAPTPPPKPRPPFPNKAASGH